MQKYCAICLDIGGTFIKYALITKNGELYNFDKAGTIKSGAGDLIKQVYDIIEQLIVQTSDYEIEGIGISSAGQVDHTNGKIIYGTNNLPGWTGVNLKDIIERRFKLECHVENDVNAAALGEMHFGSAKAYSDFVCMTIGTGIGGAIVKGSELIHGVAGSAGEIGHMIIKAGGKKCNCGNRGCFEQYASVTALFKDIERKLGKSYVMGNNGIEWFLNRYETDGRAKALIDKYAEYISAGIISLVHIFNPSAVIIGGAVSANELLINEVRKNVFKNAMPEFIRSFEVVPTLLGNRASLFGMSIYVFEKDRK